MPKIVFSKEDPVVRLDVRMPKSLHYELAEEAHKQKISLNQVILNKLKKS